MPFISVIITAHNRKEFLLEAVNSALNQTLPKDEYEIIVVKNFQDFDDILTNLGIKTVFSNEENQGSDVANALPYAEGDVVCFLDDDDLWVPWKLEKVKQMFEKERLCYYHHALLAFRQGESTDEIVRESKINNIEFLRGRFVDLSTTNSSSTCVKKDLLYRCVNLMKKVRYFIDNFYYYIALLQNCGIKFDPTVLTLYRWHRYNSTALKAKNFNEWLKKKAEFYANRYEVITELLNTCKAEKISEDARRELLKQALSDKITVTRLTNDKRYRAGFVDYLRYIRLDNRNIRGILLASLAFAPRPIQLYIARKWYEKEQKEIA